MVKSQGCSDAGFCSSGLLQSGTLSKREENEQSISIAMILGEGENVTRVSTVQLEFKSKIKNSLFVELKIPFTLAKGNLGNNSNLGDPIISFSRLIKQYDDWILNMVAGSRVSLGNANKLSESGGVLPMVYQANLGTTDLIFGVNLNWKNYIRISTALQQPFFQYNKNQYLSGVVVQGAESLDYFSSRNLQRKGDILLKADGVYQKKNLSISAGPLLIYHLANDLYTDIENNEVEFEGSKGLTLNIAGSVSHTFSNIQLDLIGGVPLIVRDSRPDGLTRSWVVSTRLTYTFSKKTKK